MTTRTERDWDRRFTEVKPRSGEHYWEENEIRNVPAKRLWTEVEAGNKIFIVPGYHRVNRLGYIVTKEEWNDKDLNDEWRLS